MTSNSAIWRDSGTEYVGDNNEKINFNEEPISVDGAIIAQSDFNIVSAIGINEKPKGNVNEIQDTFVDSITLTITGSISNPKNVSSINPFKTVKIWMLDPKTVVTTFPKGRFGLRLDDFPHFNLNPTATRAYILYDWRWIREGEWTGRVSFVATLKFNGNIGIPPYNWA